MKAAIHDYLRSRHPLVLVMDALRVGLLVALPLLATTQLKNVLDGSGAFAVPVHRLIFREAGTAAMVYLATLIIGTLLTGLWLGTALRNFAAIALQRGNRSLAARKEPEMLMLPPFPYRRESFSLVLAEVQDRDGNPVPNDDHPELLPSWLVIPELALYTGIWVDGVVGSGKTASAAYRALQQLLGHLRVVPVRRKDGTVVEEPFKWSGLILDEKGDFTRYADGICARTPGRENDLIRIKPGGHWLYNVIYNPTLPSWAVAYQLLIVLRNANKGETSADPFWENAPRELVTDFIGLLHDALSYYTIIDYLHVLIDDDLQNQLNAMAQERLKNDPIRLADARSRWLSITGRRDRMGTDLRGSLEACAKQGFEMFKNPEMRATFAPTAEEYFEVNAGGVYRPRANVFLGFDAILEHGKLVGLEMPKEVYYTAADFVQVALKTQWQDAIMRRDTIVGDQLIVPPRFGAKIGYVPSFLMADECQDSATPKDGEFMAKCRSKRACMFLLSQSYSSVESRFGENKKKAANTFFQNMLTKIHFRQADPDSIERIQKEIGKKTVVKTTLTVTEGGNATDLNYFTGGFVHNGVGVSATKQVATEEKPFLEAEELQSLPNYVAVISPSNGNQTLPATIAYTRPGWVFENPAYSHLTLETPWRFWDEELRRPPKEWAGWKLDGPLEERDLPSPDLLLGKFAIHGALPKRPDDGADAAGVPPPLEPDRPAAEGRAHASGKTKEPRKGTAAAAAAGSQQPTAAHASSPKRGLDPAALEAALEATASPADGPTLPVIGEEAQELGVDDEWLHGR
jgi:hypothetical protein